jgi:hypothetical protein
MVDRVALLVAVDRVELLTFVGVVAADDVSTIVASAVVPSGESVEEYNVLRLLVDRRGADGLGQVKTSIS